MYHSAFIPRHNYSFRQNQQQYHSSPSTDSHKVFLLKEYILQLQLHIAYLQKQLEYSRESRVVESVQQMMDREGREELIQENIILGEECMIKEEELLLVIQDNILLKEKLGTISGEEKNRAIEILAEMNRKLQEVNMECQRQILVLGKVEVANAEMRLEVERWMEECGRLKEELFEKRHVYSKFKLCLNELNALEIKYKKYDASYKSSLGYNSCV